MIVAASFLRPTSWPRWPSGSRRSSSRNSGGGLAFAMLDDTKRGEGSAERRKVRHTVCLLFAVSALSALGIAGCESTSTPVKLEACRADETDCFVDARFRDFDSCEHYRILSNSLCDWESRSGILTCKTCSGKLQGCSDPTFVSSRCTK